MSDSVDSNDFLLQMSSRYQLKRREFLKASLAAGLGGAFLAGCNGGTSSSGGSAGLPKSTPAHAISQGLPEAPGPLSLGVNGHFTTASDLEAQVEKLAAIGFGFMRLDLLWSLVERSKGQYDFSDFEGIVSTLAGLGIRPLFILDYNNALYDDTKSPPSTETGPHTDAARQAFGRFAAAAVAKFKGQGVIWEIWNEPDNPPFWYPKPNPDDYMALAKVAITAMRQADPVATIVAPALTGLEPKYQSAWNFLERCFALGLVDLVDAISVHPYRLGPPETAASDYQRLRTLIARYAAGQKVNLPIISSEWGYSLTWVSQVQQAEYFVRLFIINLANNVPVSIWYDWQDGPDPKQINDNFGMITWTGQPKMVYFAAQTLTSELKDFHFAQQVSLPSAADYASLFTNGGARKQVVWTSGNPHTVTLPVNATSVTITSMTGEKHTLPTTDGHVALQLTGSPQYIAF